MSPLNITNQSQTSLPSHPVFLYDFKPVPESEREHPKRTRSASARLYIDKYVEHREAHEFLQRQLDLHGDGSRTIVRGLLLCREVVEGPQGHPVAAPPRQAGTHPGGPPAPPGGRDSEVPRRDPRPGSGLARALAWIRRVALQLRA